MAKETAKASIYLDGKQAEAALDSMSRRAKDLKKDFDAAQKAGDQIKMNKLEKELRNVESAQRSLRKESFDTQKVLQNLNGSSFNDLTKALKTSQRELKRMGETDPGYKDKLRDVVTLKTRVKELSDQQAVHTSLWGKMANGANKYFNVMMAGVAIITGVIFSMSQFVKGMLGLDDALADVMKTTGLTRREVREMYTDFRYFNTRTPRAELLALAEEAGRLGIVGKKNIMDFVEVANKIKISLGDDLGGNPEEAIKEVGKLTQIFKIGSQYNTDYKTSLEKVGSGLNQVANNSNASAGYLIEYMKRLGGIADQSKITAADIMGYASVFDQLGQNVEMAATAQSKIIVDMFTDPAKYARIARMEVGAFSKMLKTDANEAFIKFLEGLNGNNEGLSEMATKLDDLGIDGARATQALAALSSNTKMLREQQDLANDAMNKGTSLQTEYAIKNENLAGSWAKVTAIIQAKFINSGFISFLEKVVGKTAEWMQQPVEAKLQKEQQELNVLVGAITNVNTKQENRNDLIKEIQEKYPDFLKNLDTEKMTNEQLKTRLEEVNKQYEDRILLMIKEDMLQKNYKERTELKLEELDLLKQIAAYEITASKAREKIKGVTDPNQFRSILSQEEFDALNSIPIVTAALERNRTKVDELKKSEQDLNDALGQLRQNKPADNATDSTSTDNTLTTIPLADPKEIKKASDKAIEALDTANNAIQANLIAQYKEQGWTDARFKMQQLIAEQAYLEERKKILQKYGLSTVDIDNQINQKQIESQKEFNAAISEMEKENQKDQDEALKIENDHADAIVDATKDALDKSKDLQEKEKQQLEQRAQMYSQISGTIVNSISSMLDGSLDEYATYGDALILMALQVLKQLAPIWAAQIVGGSLATPDSIMSGGISGVIKFTAMLAIMEGFIAVAEGAVKKGIDNKREAASGKKTGFIVGGPTGGYDKRKVAGVVHEDEYVIPSEGYNAPGVRPIVDLMEIARRNGSLARLDLRPVVASIGTGKKGYSGGGPVGSSSRSGSNSPVIDPGVSSDPELTKAINRLNSNLEKGIKASINKYGTNGVEEALKEIAEFNSKVYKQ